MHKNTENSSDKDLKKAVLIVTAFAAFLTPFLGSSVNLALPSIGKDLGANAIGLSWIISSFILSSAIFLIPFGRLADILGRKKIFTWGLIIFTISTFVIIFSKTLAFLIVLRIIQGISSSMIFGTSLAIISSVFAPGERGRAMGINITAVYLGLSAGPVIGGFLTQYLGWRSIFTFLVPFGLASIALIKIKIKAEWADSHNEKFDKTGSFFYAVSLFSLIYGFSTLPSASGWIFISAGVILAVLFFLYEKRINNPVFDVRLMLHNRVFAFSGIAALIHYSATSAIGFFISLYLQYLKGFDAQTAGFIMISQPVMMALLSPLAGKLSDRYNPGVIASYGMGLTAAGLIVLCLINIESPLILIISLLMIMGVGFGLFSSPNSNAIMSSVNKNHLGVASGVVGTMRMVGQMFSMGIAMMFISLYLGKEQINPSNYPEFLSTMRTGFIVFSILSVFGIFASLARNNRFPEKEKA
ncbi:MAG: MFS transporter [Bacteroidales bacterium]|nr:MFS transporter [Bacteroidales bacterium]